MVVSLSCHARHSSCSPNGMGSSGGPPGSGCWAAARAVGPAFAASAPPAPSPAAVMTLAILMLVLAFVSMVVVLVLGLEALALALLVFVELAELVVVIGVTAARLPVVAAAPDWQ